METDAKGEIRGTIYVHGQPFTEVDVDVVRKLADELSLSGACEESATAHEDYMRLRSLADRLEALIRESGGIP